jgi:hypothetical protein
MQSMKSWKSLIPFAAIGLCVSQAVRVSGQEGRKPTQPPPESPAAQTLTLSGWMTREYRQLQRNLSEAAAKMPEEDYGFRPTPAIRPYGQLVAHTALLQFMACSELKGEPNPRKDEKDDAPRTKEGTIALLEASTRYCDPLVDGSTEANVTELTQVEKIRAAKGILPVALIGHGQEMYGVMTVYLRLKGHVPPSTERMNREMEKRR